ARLWVWPPEARTAVGEALTELQLLTACAIDITYHLHKTPDRHADVARAAHSAFVAAAGPLVRA
ncbi:hypothetical protein ACFWB6_27735, partial [Streptomyces mirabilis]